MSATDDKSEKPRRLKAGVRRVGMKHVSQSEPAASDRPQPGRTDAEKQDLVAEQADGSRDVLSGDATAGLPKDSFDYVIPEESWKQRRRHKRSSSTAHRERTKTATPEEMAAMEDGYVFAVPSRKKKRRSRSRRFRHLPLWKRILIVTLCVLLTLITALAGTVIVLNEIGRRSLMNYENAEITTPKQDESGKEIVQVDNRGHVITYDGVSYELNDELFSVVFIGADEGDEENADLQMADAIYILTVDTKTGKVKILSISRDTMTDVDLYSDQGMYIDTQRMQIAFSYAYGSDAVTGGKNTVTSLSRLFYGLPMENYFAINLDALLTLNDMIGGVTLTSSITFVSPIDGRTIQKGETVTLHGKEAEYYIRTRDSQRLDANNDRMKRQQEYISAFISSIVPSAKKDMSVIGRMYDEIKVNSDTTLDLPKITYIASTALTKLSGGADVEYISLTGEITDGEYAEMNLKNQDVIRTMLDVFYQPLAEVPETFSQ